MSYLCREIWSDEWSGVLFYETSGEFGEENFSIAAKGLFLMDIGNHTYTEYDLGDPELVKFMMANPDTLRMKKGHIHSHNTMSVFFSGTDDRELVDNCGYHNFYLSLIVNNKNEMCAKIAFKAKAVVETCTTFHFRNQNGEERNRPMTNKREVEGIYAYKCRIVKPEEGEVDSFFKSRFQELKGSKVKEAAKKASEAATIRDKAFKGFNVDERWRQSGLFDDVKGSHHPPKGEKERTSIYAAEQWQRDREREWEEPSRKKSVVERVSSKTDPRVYSMLTKLLQLDHLYEGSLREILVKLDRDFYPPETDYSSIKTSYPAQLYYDTVEQRAIEFYVASFPEDQKLKEFDNTMELCVDIIDSFEDEFPELVTELTESLNLEIK